MEAGPVIYTYNVTARHFPEQAFLYFLSEWDAAWQSQEYIKRNPQGVSDAGL